MTNKKTMTIHNEWLVETPPYSLQLIRSSMAIAKDALRVSGVHPGTFDGIQKLADPLHAELMTYIKAGEIKRAESIAVYLKELLDHAVFAARAPWRK